MLTQSSRDDMYGRFFRGVLHPFWETQLRKRKTYQYLDFLQHSQWWKLEKLRAWQNSELAALISHAAKHVPYYAQLLADAGLVPGDIASAEDLTKLPILERRRAQSSQPLRIADNLHGSFVDKYTGGTTGEPLNLQYDLNSEYWRQAVKLRGFSWAGFRPGDVSVHYWGAALKAAGKLQKQKVKLDRAIRRETYFDCTWRGDDQKDKVIAALKELKPRVMFSYAQAGAELARYINQNHLRDWPNIAVLCSAERVMPPDRVALAKAFGPDIFETYGCREVMLIGIECPEHAGLHLSMENLIVELVDDHGNIVPPGVPGHVLLTDLHNYRQPLLRYKNGDMAVAEPPGRCACGRESLRLKYVDGRSTETLKDGKGNSVDGMVFNLIFSVIADHVRQFQAVQHKNGAISVKFIPWQDDIPADAKKFMLAQTEKYLPGVPVTFHRVAELPTSSSGKRRIIVVE